MLLFIAQILLPEFLFIVELIDAKNQSGVEAVAKSTAASVPAASAPTGQDIEETEGIYSSFLEISNTNLKSINEFFQILQD